VLHEACNATGLSFQQDSCQDLYGQLICPGIAVRAQCNSPIQSIAFDMPSSSFELRELAPFRFCKQDLYSLQEIEC